MWNLNCSAADSMRSRVPCILFLCCAGVTTMPAQTVASSPAGVLQRLSIATVAGSGSDSIAAIAADAAGNIYVAGTTTSPDLPIVNAAQPQGEAEVYSSENGGSSWTKEGNPSSAPEVIQADPVNPGVVFVGGADGLYKSIDSGKFWRKVYNAYINAIAIYPQNPAHIYACCSNSLAESRDGGNTWTTTNVAGLPVVSPWAPELVIAGTQISRDGGTTWSAFNPPVSNLTAVVFDPCHPNWIYAAGVQTLIPSGRTDGLLALSTDGGTTWMPKVPPAPFSSTDSLMFDPDVPNLLYATVGSAVYRSQDSAATWSLLPFPGFNPPGPTQSTIRMTALSRQCGSAAGLLAANSSGPIQASPDFGATWLPPQLSLMLDVSAGAGCAAFALKKIGPDGFVGKFSTTNQQWSWLTYLGGGGPDQAAALTLDPNGNLYITGGSSSADFPASNPPIGTPAQQNMFAVKYDTNGNLLYSELIGGEGSQATGSAVDSAGNLAIISLSPTFSNPYAAGAFVLKLGPDGSLVFASSLSTPNPGPNVSVPRAVTFDSSGDVMIGMGRLSAITPEPPLPPVGMLIGLDPSGTTVITSIPIDGDLTGLQADSQGNILITGGTGDPAFPLPLTGYAGQRSSTCPLSFMVPLVSLVPYDPFVIKLHSTDLQPLYTALLGGDCASAPGSLTLDSSGAPIVTVSAAHDFPLEAPVLGAPPCSGPAVFRLAADGSALTFSSFLSSCDPTPASVAPAPDGSLYAAVNNGGHAALLAIPSPAPPTPSPSINSLVNAFSGAEALVPGMFLSIQGQNLAASWLNEWISSAQSLPTTLGGVEVLFDGNPAPLLQVSPQQLICVVPQTLAGSTTVQVSNNGALSNAVIMPVSASLAGLYSQSFPSLPALDGSVDGDIYNSDGTQNDAQHPAAAGSFVTVFATGLLEPNPPLAAGAIATTTVTLPSDVTMELFVNNNLVFPVVSTMPGFVNSILKVQFQIPATISNGTTQRVLVMFRNPQDTVVGNRVGLYVR